MESFMKGIATNTEIDQAQSARAPVSTGFRSTDSQSSRMKVWSGQRLLSRALAVPFDYADLYANPEAARRGEFDPEELFAATTCKNNGGEDDT